MQPTSSLDRKWIRFRTGHGRIYYVTHLNEHIILQIWQDKSKWHWAVIGWPNPLDKEKLVLQTGIAETLRGARIQIETYIPKDEQLVSWINL